ncbi:MAG TPA: hypothetical protein VL970_13300, partial [Candidatus Acidoferrales bacterium]|nr:hypothetical protein [Candidatus Acidoferrales bacterium]
EAARLVQLIEQAIEMTRALSHQLDPVELKTGRLEDHLEDLAAGTTQRFKVACQFDCHLHQRLESATAMHLYRIAQEAVSKAVKHPGVKKISIGLDGTASDIILTIKDDGTAPAEEMSQAAAAGRAMILRADLIGAALKLERLADRGTQLTCVLPFSRPSHASQN